MIKFMEYLNEKGKLVEKPVVDAKADYKGKIPNKPDQGKGSVPYTPANKPAGKKSPEKNGLSEKGDKKLKYNPDTKIPTKIGEGGKKIPTYPDAKIKTTTESFLEATQDMSITEFAKFVSESNKAGEANAAQPIRYVKYITSLLGENNNLVSALIHDARRNGLLGLIIHEALQYNDGIQTLVDIMGDDVVGPKFCRRLTKAMSEEVAPPVAGLPDDHPSNIPTDPVGDTDHDELDPNAAPPEDMPTDPNEVPPEEHPEEDDTPVDPDHPDHEPHRHIGDPDTLVNRLHALKGTATEHLVSALAGHPKLLEHMILSADHVLKK